MDILIKLFIFSGCLLSLSTAQCTGSLSNSTQRVSLSWRVTGANSVMFTYTAPSNHSQYTAVVFSVRNIGFDSISNVGMIYKGDGVFSGSNEANGFSFVQDWHLHNSNLDYDIQQDLTNTSTSVNANNMRITVFTRPIVSTDKNNDTDLNTCFYAGFSYGGLVRAVTPNTKADISAPTNIGVFDKQICLNQITGCLPQVFSSASLSAVVTSCLTLMMTFTVTILLY